MISLRLAVLLGLPIGLQAFSDTHPLLVWSSASSSSLDAAAAKRQLTLQTGSVVDNVLRDDICLYDAVVVFEQPGLHASDLNRLAPTSYIAKKLESAPSSLHIPYVQSTDAIAMARDIAQKCGSQYIDLDQNSDVTSLPSSGKFAFGIDLPEVDSVGPARKAEMKQLDTQLSEQLTHVEAAFPSHLVIVTGSPRSSFSNVKREVTDPQRTLPSSFASSIAPTATQKHSAPKGGILHRYQLLTPALITSVIIAFGLLVPLMLLAVNALASIKSPIRSDGVKQAQEKKNQ